MTTSFWLMDLLRASRRRAGICEGIPGRQGPGIVREKQATRPPRAASIAASRSLRVARPCGCVSPRRRTAAQTDCRSGSYFASPTRNRPCSAAAGSAARFVRPMPRPQVSPPTRTSTVKRCVVVLDAAVADGVVARRGAVRRRAPTPGTRSSGRARARPGRERGREAGAEQRQRRRRGRRRGRARRSAPRSSWRGSSPCRRPRALLGAPEPHELAQARASARPRRARAGSRARRGRASAPPRPVGVRGVEQRARSRGRARRRPGTRAARCRGSRPPRGPSEGCVSAARASAGSRNR